MSKREYLENLYKRIGNCDVGRFDGMTIFSGFATLRELNFGYTDSTDGRRYFVSERCEDLEAIPGMNMIAKHESTTPPLFFTDFGRRDFDPSYFESRPTFWYDGEKDMYYTDLLKKEN